MHDPRLPELFDRYRRKDDLAALAEVFDAVAPELLRVARHVAGRGVDPEDVVQATFLAAIERADAYDETRPLVPWLMGILTNQARLANRRRATRREQAPVEDVAGDESGASGPEEAEAHEVRDAVARALRDLPDTYRDVLIAHLAEGKAPHEIASEMGRPQGTVRAQIHRGLRLVRRALPAGFAFGAAALLGRSALARMREDVLSTAARARGLPASAIPRAATRWGPLSAVAASLAIVAGVVALAWGAGGGAARTVEPSAGLRVDADGTRAGALAAVGAARGERDAVAAAAGVPRDAAPVPAHGTVLVRVRTARDLPATGVRVDLLDWGDPLWHEHPLVRHVDANGEAFFERVHVGRFGLHLDGGEQVRANAVAGEVTELALYLPSGLDVSGTVVDASGLPVSGAIVEAFADPAAPPRAASAPTGADGRFLLPDLSRTLAVAARAGDRGASEFVWLGTPGWVGVPRAELELRLAEPAAILDVTVVDERGAAVPGARLEIGGDARATRFRADGTALLGGRGVLAATDAHGRARLPLDAHGGGRLRVEAAGHAVVELAVPRSPAHVVLPRAARVFGRASLPDGGPALGARIEAWPEGWTRALETRADAAGDWGIDGLPPGPARLVARSAPGAPPIEQRIEALAAAAVEWNARVAHALVIRGVALSTGDRPCKTWLVKAVREGPDAPGTARWAGAQQPVRAEAEFLQCYTDDQGRFTVPCESGATYRLELRPRANWQGPVLGAVDGVASGTQDVTLRLLEARAWIRGRLLDAAGRPARGAVVAVARNSGATLATRPDAATGEFGFDLFPGAYDLLAWPADGAPRVLGSRDLAPEEAWDLGAVRLAVPGVLAVDARGAGVELTNEHGLAFAFEDDRDELTARLPPGIYVLRGRAADGTAFERSVEVVSGRRTAVRAGAPAEAR